MSETWRGKFTVPALFATMLFACGDAYTQYYGGPPPPMGGTGTGLVAAVGPGMVISFKKGATKVATLKPGVYKIAVKDLSQFHNFHLTGPGVNKATTVSQKVTTTWNVTLKKGTYRFVCDAHPTVMKGSFIVKP